MYEPWLVEASRCSAGALNEGETSPTEKTRTWPCRSSASTFPAETELPTSRPSERRTIAVDGAVGSNMLMLLSSPS